MELMSRNFTAENLGWSGDGLKLTRQWLPADLVIDQGSSPL